MNYVKGYFVGILSFIICICILLLIVSAIFAYTNIEDRYIETCIFASLAFSSFFSSLFLCKKVKKNGLIHGAILNVICVLILFGISCFINNSFIITNTLGIYIGICILSGIVGGILGVNI